MIGFAGLGEMGTPMASNLLRAGCAVKVWNRTPARAEPLVEQGAEAVSSPSALGGCDVIVTMVSDGPDVAAVALGPDGFLTTARAGTLWIDCSSISPSMAVDLARNARLRDVDAVDAPVSGGTRGATDATLAIMVGGTDEAFHRAAPVLDILGANVTHVGPNGAGQTAKLVNQMIVGGTIALVAEGLTLATAAGCSAESIRDALAGGFADSKILQVHGGRMIEGTFAPGFRSVLQLKDLTNAVAAASENRLPVPVTSLVTQLFTALVARGNGELDHSGLIVLLRELAGDTGPS
jgi:2-hydroxy-3-oxopropionate reductase